MTTTGLMVLDVIVKDENDNKPKFERSYTASVAENAPSNQYIIQVSIENQSSECQNLKFRVAECRCANEIVTMS